MKISQGSPEAWLSYAYFMLSTIHTQSFPWLLKFNPGGCSMKWGSQKILMGRAKLEFSNTSSIDGIQLGLIKSFRKFISWLSFTPKPQQTGYRSQHMTLCPLTGEQNRSEAPVLWNRSRYSPKWNQSVWNTNVNLMHSPQEDSFWFKCS